MDLKIIEDNYMIVDYNSLMEIHKEAKQLLEKSESEEIGNEIGDMFVKVATFEVEHDTNPIREFLISTNTRTAEFLLSGVRKTNKNGVDAYISYENIISAYLTAIKTHNSKMANRIEPLMRDRIYGFINEFQDKYDLAVLKYIKENGDLQAFIENRPSIKKVSKVSQYETKYDEYVIYENGEVYIKRVKKLTL